MLLILNISQYLNFMILLIYHFPISQFINIFYFPISLKFFQKFPK